MRSDKKKRGFLKTRSVSKVLHCYIIEVGMVSVKDFPLKKICMYMQYLKI